MAASSSQGKKRSRAESALTKRVGEAIGVKGISERAVRLIWNIAQPEGSCALTESVFKKQVNLALADAQCFDSLELPSKKEPTETLAIANIPKLMKYVGSHMPVLASLLAHVLRANGNMLSPVIYHDEAQASNLLAVRKKMKATLIYFSWLEFGPWLHHEDMWLCIGLIQHSVTDNVIGGLAITMKHLISHILHDDWATGFAIDLCLAHVHQSVFSRIYMSCKERLQNRQRVGCAEVCFA